MAKFTAKVTWKSWFPNARNDQMPGFSSPIEFFTGVFTPQKSRLVRFYTCMPHAPSTLEATEYYFCVFSVLDR